MLGQSSVQQADKPGFILTLEMVLSIHVLGKDGREVSTHHNLSQQIVVFGSVCVFTCRIPTPRRG